MKRYINILMVALATMMTSCLTEDPRDQLYEEDIYNNANNIYINAVAVLYNYIGGSADSEGLQGTCRGIYDYNTLTTDEAMIPIRGGDWYDGGLWTNMYQHKWSPNDLPLYNTWKYLYKVVVLSNKSLHIIDKYSHNLSEEQRVAYEAEVRALRALFYYYIMDMYGRVPIVTSYEQPQDEVVQSERSEVFRFIVNELQEVAELLPNERSNKMGNYYGRITTPVANFLLAKLALNAEIYCDDNWTDGVPRNGKEIFFTVDGDFTLAVQAGDKGVAARLVGADFLALIKGKQGDAYIAVLRQGFADDLPILIGNLIAQHQHLRLVDVFHGTVHF